MQTLKIEKGTFCIFVCFCFVVVVWFVVVGFLFLFGLWLLVFCFCFVLFLFVCLFSFLSACNEWFFFYFFPWLCRNSTMPWIKVLLLIYRVCTFWPWYRIISCFISTNEMSNETIKSNKHKLYTSNFCTTVRLFNNHDYYNCKSFHFDWCISPPFLQKLIYDISKKIISNQNWQLLVSRE